MWWRMKPASGLTTFFSRSSGRLPKSRVYRMVRSGEVRVNGGRAKFHTRLAAGDRVRLPPVRVGAPAVQPGTLPDDLAAALAAAIMERTEDLLVVNKPAGMAVHGGSGLSWGLIEALRVLYGPRLELVHRLDRETSGVLLVARNRQALKAWQAQFRPGVKTVQKQYLSVVDGRWPARLHAVTEPLLRFTTPAGERRVRVAPGGKPAHSEFVLVHATDHASVVQVTLKTGRTHQIRVHAASRGHPVLGDDKYGSSGADARAAALGVHRLALHAARLSCTEAGLAGEFVAPLPADLTRLLTALNCPADSFPLRVTSRSA